MSTQLAIVEQPTAQRQRLTVVDPVPVLDTARFEQMYRIAKIMAQSNLIPETLCATYEGTGPSRVTKWLPIETITSNVFLIVNQAVGWGMDPFAVAQCASVVYGRVCYEGKLIAAVIDQKLGVNLDYEWNDKLGDAMGIRVFGTIPGETKVREMKGTVGEWKTTGNGSPWIKQPRMQLAYRGARDWARLHKPALMLGVYSVDEMESAMQRQERLPPPMPSYVPDPPRAATVETVAAPKPTQPNPDAPRAKPTPPNPNKPTSAPPKPAQESPKPFNFDAFRAALQAAATQDEANAIWEREVERRTPPLTEDDADEAQRMLSEICEKFWSNEEV